MNAIDTRAPLQIAARRADGLRTTGFNVSPPTAEDSARKKGIGPLPYLAFGMATAFSIRVFSAEWDHALDRLLVGAGIAALATAMIWIALLAARRSRAWAVAMALGIWIPYVNLLLTARYARRHWRDDAAAPGWLALAGMGAQLLASLRVLFSTPPPLA